MRNFRDFVPPRAAVESAEGSSPAFARMHPGGLRASGTAAGAGISRSAWKSSQAGGPCINQGTDDIFTDTGISQNGTRNVIPMATPEMMRQSFSSRQENFRFDSASPENLAWMSVGMKSVYLYRYLIGLTDFKVCLGRAEIPAGSGTFMCETTKRKCFATLRHIRAIAWARRIRLGAWQGLEFGLDETMKNAFLDLYGEFEIFPSCQADCHSNCHSDYQTGGAERKIKYKETSFLLSAHDLLKHPELEFWVDEGLNANKFTQWTEEFGIDLETMDRYLKWAAYDITHRRMDGSIRNAMNWFYQSIRKSGFYKKPEGYVSLEEQRMQAVEDMLREKAEMQRRREEQERRSRELDISAEIEAVIQEGESNELYREAVGSLPSFATGEVRHALVRNHVRMYLKKRYAVNDVMEQDA